MHKSKERVHQGKDISVAFDYNVYLENRKDERVLPWQDVFWHCRSRWSGYLGTYVLKDGPEIGHRPLLQATLSHRNPGDGILMHPLLISGEESWVITSDFSLADTQRSQAVSAKMSWKYLIIIDDNLLTQKAMDLAQEESVFDLLLIGTDMFLRTENELFSWVWLILAGLQDHLHLSL